MKGFCPRTPLSAPRPRREDSGRRLDGEITRLPRHPSHPRAAEDLPPQSPRVRGDRVHLVESCRPSVNAYVVKPVDFREFISAVKSPGLFRAVVDRPPPGSVGTIA